jgi:hypothetical protein
MKMPEQIRIRTLMASLLPMVRVRFEMRQNCGCAPHSRIAPLVLNKKLK